MTILECPFAFTKYCKQCWDCDVCKTEKNKVNTDCENCIGCVLDVHAYYPEFEIKGELLPVLVVKTLLDSD